MNTEYLRYFEYAYEEKNYSAAARRVPVSPQGLKKGIASLEKELGVTLFSADPDTGMPVPTEYAQELAEYAAVLDSNTRLLMESFERIHGKERQELRLGCSLGVIGALGPDFLEEFRAMRPDVHVSYWETNDTLCDEGLRRGDYDLALAVGPYDQRFETRELYRCQVYYWVNAADSLASKPALTVDDLGGRDVALPGEGFKCYNALLAQARAHNVQLGRVFEMSEIFHLYEYAAKGRGLGFTARHQIELPFFASDTSVVAVPAQGMEWAFGIGRLPTHALNDAEQAFWNHCVSYARRLQGA